MTEKIKRRWNSLSRTSRWTLILVAFASLATGAFVGFALDNDRDADMMDDSYESFFALDPSDPSDSAYDLDNDTLIAQKESLQWTDPRAWDTDVDGWSDAEDDAISRAYIPWGREEFTVSNSVTYVGPDWWLAAGKINGDWDFETRSWFMSGASSNNLGALYVDLDRATLTNNIVYKLDFHDFPESSLQLDLLNADRECIAPNLFGNLCEGSDERNVIALDVPLAAYPSAATICIRRESGPARVYTSVLYEDFDGDGLDRLQELQLHTSDADLDSDDDGISDYDEVFVRHTDPARPDFITGDDEDDEESAPTVPGTSISTNNIRFDSILGWWQLNESKDDFVLDSSQYHNHGTVQGSLRHIAGERCYAAYFDGKDNSIAIRNSSDYKPGSCLTIGLYAQFGNAAVTEPDVLMSVPNGASGFAYALYRNSDNAIVFELSGPSGSTVLKTRDDYIQTGKWYWIMGTWNGANAVLYVCTKGEDGYTDRLIDSKPHSGPINYDRSAGLSMACPPEGMGANRFYGIIDEPFVLNVATHPAELRRAFDAYTENGMSFEERRIDYLEEHPEVTETLRTTAPAPAPVMTKGVFLMKSGGPTPEVTITNPTACASYATGSDPLTIGGSASDDNGITNMVWSNNRGGEGTVFSIAAPGVASTNWSCSVTNLQGGLNRITFSAYDTNGLCGTDRISVFLISAPPTDGLVLYYPFDTDQTNIVSDVSGSGYTGTVSGATFTNAGWDGNAYWFDGVNDYISAGDVLDCGTNANPNLTVAAWIKFPSGLYNSEMWYLGKVIQPSGLRGWCFNTRNGENRAALVHSAGGSMAYAVQSSPSMTDDEWHLICGTFEDGTNFMRAVSYIDSSANNTTSTYYMSNPVTDNNGELWLGARYNGTAWYQGYIDEVRIYDRILSSDEIDSLTNTPPSGILMEISDPENDGSTIYTNVSSMAVSGAAWSETNVTSVSWTNDAGYSGSCTGTNEWTASSVTLATGVNHIVFTAIDALTNSETDEIDVYRSPSGSPVVIVTNPTMTASYMVCATNIVLKGLAYSDITNMTWSNHRGGSGTIFTSASPGAAHTNWVTASIGLETGVNHIVISAWDDNGDVGQDTISVFSPEGITTEGLALYYSFDTDEGSTVTDQSGNGYDGTVSGALHTNAGQYGGAYWFDGVNDNISAGNVLDVGTNSNPELTVSAWVKVPAAETNTEMWLITKTCAPSAIRGWGMNTRRGELRGAVCGDPGHMAYPVHYPPPNLCDDDWHFVCGVFEVTNTYIKGTVYVEDSANAATNLHNNSNPVTENSGELLIADRYSDDTAQFHGFVDELRIYTRKLSPEEIDSLTNAPYDDIMIEIFSPDDNGATYNTNTYTITVEGAAWSTADLTDVAWTNETTGASGACVGTEEWASSGIALATGVNHIVFTATDSETNTASDSMDICFTDETAPTVEIDTPTAGATWSTSNQYINISGTATDHVEVALVAWSNDQGGSGTCSGTDSWSQDSIFLYSGTNVITVTGYDSSSNSGSDTLTVTYCDITAPSVTIQNPTTNATWSTTNRSLDISGIATDNVDVASVTWSNDRGSSGSCTGTTAWGTTGIDLYSGTNVITITAYDAQNNSSTDTLTVTVQGLPGDVPDTGLALWVKADDGVTTDSNTNVTRWADQSGYGNDLTQTTETNRPAMIEGDTNSESCVRFNGIEDALDGVHSPSGQVTLVVARRYLSFGTQQVALVTCADTNTPCGGFLMGASSTSSPQDELLLQTGVGVTNWPDGVNHADQNTLTTNWAIDTLRIAVTNTEMWTDCGVMVNDTENGAIGQGTALDIGQTGESFNGDVAELLAYTSALSNAELIELEVYLGDKYGVELEDVDRDEDGLPDEWEHRYFGDLDEDREGDFDEDGVSNGDEYDQGRDPTKPGQSDTEGVINLEVYTELE